MFGLLVFNRPLPSKRALNVSVVAESVDRVSNILPNDGVDDMRDCASDESMMPGEGPMEDDMAIASGGMSIPPRSASAGFTPELRSAWESSSSYGDLMDFMSACSDGCCWVMVTGC